MEIINKIGKYRQSNRAWYTRDVSGIRVITVHHTASQAGNKTDDQMLREIMTTHVNKGWPGASYHYVITPNGNIYQLNTHKEVTWHDSHNWDSVAVCLVGYFHPPHNNAPTKESLAALRFMLDKLCTQHPEFPADYDDVKGHRERGSTACPGDILYPYVTEYRNKLGRVEWGRGDTGTNPADEFANLVKKATQWDKTVAHYALGEPLHVMFEQLRDHIAGRLADYQRNKNDLDKANEQLAIANKQVENYKDKASNVEKQLTDQKNYYEQQLKSARKDHKGCTEGLATADKRINTLETELRTAQKEKGQYNERLGTCEAKLKNAQKESGNTQSCIESLITFLSDLIRK